MQFTVDDFRRIAPFAEAPGPRPLAAPHRWPQGPRDSIVQPAEAPRPNPDYPDWLGYDPEIARLLR